VGRTAAGRQAPLIVHQRSGVGKLLGHNCAAKWSFEYPLIPAVPSIPYFCVWLTACQSNECGFLATRRRLSKSWDLGLRYLYIYTVLLEPDRDSDCHSHTAVTHPRRTSAVH
jgi:hypothetical protein